MKKDSKKTIKNNNNDNLFENIDFSDEIYFENLHKKVAEGRKKYEKETGEHYEPKYKMYIVQHKGFITNYEMYGFSKCSGKRFCFQIDTYKNALLLNVEEVINCIADCCNEFCNWRYKIIPEDEFLIEYEKYKETHKDKLEHSKSNYGFYGGRLDIDNILHQPKRKKCFEWGCLTRGYYGDRGLFGEPLDAIPYYSLYCDSMSHTSIVIDYKKTDEGIAFETRNSIYVVKKLKDIDYMDQLKEFDNFKKSKHYKELLDFVDKYEDDVMKNIMEGKKYID